MSDDDLIRRGRLCFHWAAHSGGDIHGASRAMWQDGLEQAQAVARATLAAWEGQK